MWYLSSWRDLRRRSNAGHGLGNKPEITPPSHFYHRPDGTRWTSDVDTNAHHRRLFTAAAWRGLEPAPGSGLRRAFLHLSCSLCTIGQFITNLPFLRLRRTLDRPAQPRRASQFAQRDTNRRKGKVVGPFVGLPPTATDQKPVLEARGIGRRQRDPRPRVQPQPLRALAGRVRGPGIPRQGIGHRRGVGLL